MPYADNAALVEAVVRRLPPEIRQGRDLDADVENAIPEGLRAVSDMAGEASWRPAMEILVSVTLSSADSFGRQTASLPASIVQSSIRTRDVTHADSTTPLQMLASVGELAYLKSATTLAYFAIADGRIYCRRPAGALATGTQATIRAVRLLTLVTDIPAEIEPIVVQVLINMITGRGAQQDAPGEVAA